MTEKKEELLRLPGFSIGVRPGASIRMVKVARPICPYSQVETVRTSTGQIIRKDRPPNEVNCQLSGREWWKRCEAAGHDPYFTTRKWDEEVRVVDEEGMVVGTRLIPKGERIPNVKAVPLTRRHNSGLGLKRSFEYKGCKRLREIGYMEVCQYRSCQEPVNPEFKSRHFGAYCSLLHLQLVAADAQGIFLTRVDRVDTFAPESSEKVRQKRAKQMREVLPYGGDG